MAHINETKPEVNPKNTPQITEEKPLYTKVSVKTLLSDPDIQAVITQKVQVPLVVTIQSVKKPFEDKENKDAPTVQKIHSVAGTSFLDMIEVDFTLVGTTVDAEYAIHRQYRLVDYTFALDANMVGRNFAGYSATGLKLLVTKIEELKGDNSHA